jgi:hypothetical protein
MNNSWIVITDKYSKDHYFNADKIRKFVFDYKENTLHVFFEDKSIEPLKDVSEEEAKRALSKLIFQPRKEFKPKVQTTYIRPKGPNTLSLNK